ncbi:MAG: GTPase domain-containing protein [Hyphomicrobiaceae bacterium]
MTDAAAPPEAISEQARRLAPVVWLIGKVQSGKTSIVRALTGASDAEIGAGFRACTRTARIFDFPAAAPIIRFLDTRGLGEAAYDPAADIAYCEDRAHLMLAVVKAMDAEQGAVADTVRAARERHPDWPVVVAQTTLHEAYAGEAAHILPYPFASEAAAATVPEPLRRGLAHQRSLFEGLPGRGAVRFVPIDLTQPGDGYDPVDYGREALIAALVEVAPGIVKVALQGLPGAQSDAHARSANAYILGFAAAAGASDALPVAGVVTVPVLQAAMLRQLGQIYAVDWDRRSYAEFLAALGTGTLIRTASTFGIRQLVKLVPVYGQTVGAATAAAASFAATYAIGKAASTYLRQKKRGAEVEDLATVYRDALRDAFGMARQREVEGGPRAGGG